MNKNCVLQISEMQLIRLRDKTECEVLFGPEHLKEFGSYVPEELIARYKAVYAELFEVDRALNEYNELRYK